MIKLFSRGLVISSLLLAAGGCSNNNNTSTTPTTPTTTTRTETFPGTLTTNGAVTHQFSANASGNLTATLTTLTATDSTVTVSLSLGTWNGSVCQIILANDQAAQNTIVTGTVSAASSLCVRIADANGKVPGPTPYVITVTHP